MRRRLRRQRRMREALLLDLGALVFELHRQGRREPELLQAKAAELKAVDEEVRALADALEAGDGMMQLVAAGIAGSCENCGSLLSTDARYCAACGAAALPALEASGAARGGLGPRASGLETAEQSLRLEAGRPEDCRRARAGDEPSRSPSPSASRSRDEPAEDEPEPEDEPRGRARTRTSRAREPEPESRFEPLSPGPLAAELVAVQEAPAQTERRLDASCPTCGAPAERGQLVCLECGSRIALAYKRPPELEAAGGDHGDSRGCSWPWARWSRTRRSATRPRTRWPPRR